MLHWLFFSFEEQKKFPEVVKRSHNYHQYALIPETGLRTGELVGLTWGAINWDKRTLTVSKTLDFRHKQQEWRTGEPEKNSSYDPHPYKLCDEAGIKTTMDRYVHVTDDSLNKAVQQFERLFA